MASDTMQVLVSEARRNRFSLLPNLSDEDVTAVWDAVASFIEGHMSKKKGVSVPGFGIFTLIKQKIDLGGNKFIQILRPVFVLSEKFASIHALQTQKYHITGQVPVVQLNYAALSMETSYNRDTVEGCVRDLILACSRSLQGSGTLDFVFTGIGKLTIKDSKVKMKFYKDFLQGMDGSGTLVKALSNRPCTSDSVTTACSTPDHRQLRTASPLLLPKIYPGQDLSDNDLATRKCLLPVIMEEKLDAQDKQPENPPLLADRHSDLGNRKSQILNLEGDEESFVETAQVSSAPPRLQNSEDSKEQTSVNLRSPRSLADIRPTADKQPKEHVSILEHTSVPKVTWTATAKSSSHQIPRTASGVRESNLSRPRNPCPPPKTALPRSKASEKKCSTCLHSAGQELCYLCYQRDKRNFTVDTRELERQKEIEEDRLLQQYQQLKDAELFLKTQEQKAKNREESSKVAAFNLGVSEAIKAKKSERPVAFHRSYVFDKRPLTPPHYLKQGDYSDELAKQVQDKLTSEKKESRERDLMERLEQVRLAEDLALQRENYLRNKKLQSEQYKKALDTQIYIRKYIDSQMEQDDSCYFPLPAEGKTHGFTISRPNAVLRFQHSELMPIKKTGMRTIRFRPLPLPHALPDSDGPIFGVHDITEEKLDEKRQTARKLYEEQLQMVAEKQRQKMLRDLNSQKEEIDMLARTRKDLLEEMSDRGAKHARKQKDLEENWAQASKLKKYRESLDLLRAQTPGSLVHEKCKYRRCKMCQRRLGNCGETNVWSDGRYLPGSRLIF